MAGDRPIGGAAHNVATDEPPAKCSAKAEALDSQLGASRQLPRHWPSDLGPSLWSLATWRIATKVPARFLRLTEEGMRVVDEADKR